MTLSAGTRLGPHEIPGLIGVAGTGEVQKTRDPRLDRAVAIKLFPSSLRLLPLGRAWDAVRADERVHAIAGRMGLSG